MTTADVSIELLDSIIRARKTSKLLADPTDPPRRGALADHRQAELRAMLETAGRAPMHKRAHEQTHRSAPDSPAAPWRFYVLERPDCHALIAWLRQQSDDQPDSKWTRAWQSKITDMLAACSALVQITWLPDPGEDDIRTITMTDNNIEHVAAASAATQNLLLGAEVRGWFSYWSSGGILRDPDVFTHLGIDTRQALLGSIFLADPDARFTRRIDGALREERNRSTEWLRTVRLPTTPGDGNQ